MQIDHRRLSNQFYELYYVSDFTAIFEHFSGNGDLFYSEPIKSSVPPCAWSGKASLMLFSTSATSIR